MFWRVRLKLAAWSAAALAVILLALGLTVFTVSRHSLDREIDASLSRARDDLVRDPGALVPPAAGEPGTAAPPPQSSDDDDEDDDEHERDDDDPAPDPGVAATVATDVFFVTTSAAGTVLWNPRNIGLEAIPVADLSAAAGTGERRATVATGDDRIRIATVPLPEGMAGQAAYVHIGRSLAFRDRQLRDLAEVLVAGGLVGVALAAAGGFVVAGRALIPIRAALVSQRRFLSDASHELRTPLAVVRANAELLARNPDRPVEESLEQVDAIETEASHMSSLVGDLLTLARADEGRIELVHEPFSLTEVLAEVVRDMGPLAEHRSIRLHGDLGAAGLAGDRQRIRQLAVILLDNALKFTPDGGTIAVTSRQARGFAEFSVSDSGPGIPPDEQQRVFERFYRVETSRGRASGGTGLGLAIARWIAEAHGGRISVESAPGRGTTFTVRLPVR